MVTRIVIGETMDVNLILTKKNGTTRPFPLPASVTVIGRRQECDLCIPLMKVSRRHCQLNLDGGKLTLRDLGSRNGTYVNGERVEEIDLTAGDKIGIGPLSFTIQIDGQPTIYSDADSTAGQQFGQITAATVGTTEAAEVAGIAGAAEESGGENTEEFADLDDLDDLDDLINLDLDLAENTGETIDGLDDILDADNDQ